MSHSSAEATTVSPQACKHCGEIPPACLCDQRCLFCGNDQRMCLCDIKGNADNRVSVLSTSGPNETGKTKIKDLSDLLEKVGRDKLNRTVLDNIEPWNERSKLSADAMDAPDETLAPVENPLAESSLGQPAKVRAGNIQTADDTAKYTPNDAGRAQQFIDRWKDFVRYVPEWGQWLIWRDHFWQPDDDGAIHRLAIEHSRKLGIEAAQIVDDRARADAVKTALTLGNAKYIGYMLELAKVDFRIVVHADQLDQSPDLLGVLNGVVDLTLGSFRPGQRADLITKRAGAEYQAGAACPRWLQFIYEVTCGDEELARYLQKWVGYTLTGWVIEQCFAFLYGAGNNGKSKFIEAIRALLGDCGLSAPLSLIALSPNGREPTHDLAGLQGARFVVGPELEQGMRLAESRIKDLTGGDTISGRRLYKESFNFNPVAKLWLFGNHKPTITGTDIGIWRRVRLIPFEAEISEERKDPDLGTKLMVELPGILLWALDGVAAWRAAGLHSPARVSDAVIEYKTEEDWLGDFLSTQVENTPEHRVTFGDMYSRYQLWAGRGGVRFPMSSRTLAKALRQHGLTDGRSNGGSFWLNVTLRTHPFGS